MLGDTTAEVRRMAHNLIPDVLTKYNLEKALDMYCNDINNTNQLQITVQCHGIADKLHKATELMCYRIVQELVQNIIKHAHATSASVQVMLVEGTLGIIVEDNGHGFDTTKQPFSGVGLDNLRFRVNALQGTMELLSQVNKGTAVHILFDAGKLGDGE
jgi:signal transduction histidine kinase